MEAKVISIFNQKGGVGKTTTTINLGACLALKGFKTLVIDLDAQANCTIGYGVNSFDHGTAELFENKKATLASVVNSTSITNLSIVPSDLSLTQVEWELLKNYMPSHTTILRDKLFKAELDQFDYIIIDCPPSLGLLSLNALIASDRIIVPIALDPFAIIGLKFLNTVVDDIRMTSNKKLKILGLARTIWDMRVILAKEMSENLEQDYPNKLLETIVKNTIRVRESVVAQTPIVIYEPTAPASSQYMSLCEEILKKW
jgi:chromosome partitioning protein